MDGRVKTLHPQIHGGLLARRGVDEAVLIEHGIDMIDVLAVNLYPFEATAARAGLHRRRSDREHRHRRPGDAARRVEEPRAHHRRRRPRGLCRRARGARRVRGAREPAPRSRDQGVRSHRALRHGDQQLLANAQRVTLPLGPIRCSRAGGSRSRCATARTRTNRPRCTARRRPRAGTVAHATQVQGKELSFNNIVDADAAFQAVNAFDGSACVIVKHANPCGVAVAATPALRTRLPTARTRRPRSAA